MWEKIDEMFPSGSVPIEGVIYQNKDIKESNLTEIKQTLWKPVRMMLENETIYTFYANGDLIARRTYSVYPKKMVDDIPLLNVYGQKILNEVRENGEKT